MGTAIIYQEKNFLPYFSQITWFELSNYSIKKELVIQAVSLLEYRKPSASWSFCKAPQFLQFFNKNRQLMRADCITASKKCKPNFFVPLQLSSSTSQSFYPELLDESCLTCRTCRYVVFELVNFCACDLVARTTAQHHNLYQFLRAA